MWVVHGLENDAEDDDDENVDVDDEMGGDICAWGSCGADVECGVGRWCEELGVG